QELYLSGQLPITLPSRENQESQTLFSTTIPVFGIPVLVEVEAVESYGFMAGTIDYALTPFAPEITPVPTPVDIARVSTSVTPFANAGVSLYVAVGFHAPVAELAVGVDSTLTLGNLSAPINAGAGITVTAVQDPRPLPDNLAALADPQGFPG